MDTASIINDILMLASVGVSTYATLHFVHMLQLEGYDSRMYLKWLRRNTLRDWVPTGLVFLICMLLDAAMPFASKALAGKLSGDLYEFAKLGIRFIYIVLMVYIAVSWRSLSAKKPLVFTSRIKRLIAAIALIILIINLLPYTTSAKDASLVKYLALRSGMYMPALLLPLVVLAAGWCMYPVEEGVKRWYYNDAKKKLAARTDLIKIGITGSYGKTSTKFTLGTLLGEKYKTRITPASYNTPMGITRVVREQLEPSDEVFVAEMGARFTTDIEELCELVSPTIGIITSVGKQHLETFGSQENITNTKFDLIVSLPETGAAFFNADNAICRELYGRKVNVQSKFLYGIDSREQLYMRATDIQPGPDGCEFELLAQDGGSVRCRTTLLGRHNILNIAGCAAVARYMGLSMEQIAAGIAKLKPVEHRLQLIPGPVTVIDDAFNSNPEGAKMALEVLRSFGQRTIVITPGMVELGKDEEALNEDLGAEIACSADIAILVGKKRTEPIKRGLKRLEFDEKNIYAVNSLDDASALLNTLSKPGDVVLFENDLPDNYNE